MCDIYIYIQVRDRALQHGDSTLPLSWRWKLWKAKRNVDLTTVLLHLLATGTSEEFDVSHAPLPFIHLAAACLVSLSLSHYIRSLLTLLRLF